MIDADPDLSPEAKVHIKNEYGLLKAASAQGRALQVCEQILRNGKLDDETRQQLLATLDGQMALTQPAARQGAAGTSYEVDRAARRATGHEHDEAEPEFYADAPGPEHGA
jgi:hypothetical protein